MTPGRVHIVGLLLVAPLIGGCADDPATFEGDCSAGVGWEGVVDESNNELNQSAPRGTRLGIGDVLDCDGSDVGTVEVFAIEGVDPSLAIKAGNTQKLAVYVAEGAPKSSWPDVLKPR